MSTLRLLLMLVFLGLPLLEIAVLIQVGQLIGFWPTLGLLVLSAALGMMVIREQGLSMVRRMLDAMSEGRLAFSSIVESYAVIAAGCLLIVPGFISDVMGLALLVPPLRRLVLRAMLPGLASGQADRMREAETRNPEAKRPIVIDGTYERLDDDGDPRP